jgi:biotin carboxylase
MSQPTVLFINTREGALHAGPEFRAARKLGLDVIILADGNVVVPSGMRVRVIHVDTYDAAMLVSTAETVAREVDVSGVVGWCERDVEGTAQVAEALSLPGHPLGAVARAQDKCAFRDAVRAHAPRLATQFLRIDAMASVGIEAMSLRFPMIVKPAGSSASRGIYLVNDPRELQDAIQGLRELTRPEVDEIFRRYAGQLIAEEHIDGSEHSVEGLLLGGDLVTAVITDKWVEPFHHIEYLQIHPSALSKDTQSLIMDATRDVVAAIGLGTGAFHLELKVRPDGSIGLIEMNARPGGRYITSHLVPMARGFDFMEATIALACKRDIEFSAPDAFAVAGSRQVLSETSGYLTELKGVERALGVSGILHVVLERPLGSLVSLPPVSYTDCVVASVIGEGYSHDAVQRDLSHAAGALSPAITPLAGVMEDRES